MEVPGPMRGVLGPWRVLLIRVRPPLRRGRGVSQFGELFLVVLVALEGILEGGPQVFDYMWVSLIGDLP